MAFVYERIPPEDQYRFVSLHRQKQYDLAMGGGHHWMIDRTRDVFVTFLSKRNFVHITEEIEGTNSEKLKQPQYFLMGNAGMLFGMEFDLLRETHSVDLIAKNKSVYISVVNTNLFLHQKLECFQDEYIELTNDLVANYYPLEAECRNNMLAGTADAIVIKGVDIDAPVITWFDSNTML